MAQTTQAPVSEARYDGWCGWCGQVFVDQPESVTDCTACGKSLAENPPDGPVQPKGSPLHGNFCLGCHEPLVSTST